MTSANRGFNHTANALPEAGARSLGIDHFALTTDRFAHHFAGIADRIKAPHAIQPKLDISRPGDAGEREADRVAEEVMRMPDGMSCPPDPHSGLAGPPAVQRACSCGSQSISDEGEKVRRSPDLSLPIIGERVPTSQIERNPFAGSEPVEAISGTGAAAEQDQAIAAQHTTAGGAMAQTTVPATAGSGLAASIDSVSRGGGQPLSLAARHFMEPRFGHDFRAVRIHADRTAGDLARQLQARAFTTGNRIFFAPGEFHPDRSSGKRLLAHELTHVVQQSMDGRGVRRQIQRAKSGCLNCRPYCSYGSAPLSSYNCAGLAHRTYDYKSLAATKAFLAQGSSIGCDTSCDYVGMVKHWLWEFDSRIEDSSGKVLPQPVNGVLVDSWHDFHTVAGPTAGDPVAMESDEFYSKDGQRPVYGPGTAPSFRPPVRAQATHNTPAETPGVDAKGQPLYKVNSNITESCYCFPCPKPRKSP
jgi:hypothetical protein